MEGINTERNMAGKNVSYLKAQVYQHCPQTLEGLKEAITQEVAAGRGSISVQTMKATT
jgi:hypothetical protein